MKMFLIAVTLLASAGPAFSCDIERLKSQALEQDRILREYRLAFKEKQAISNSFASNQNRQTASALCAITRRTEALTREWLNISDRAIANCPDIKEISGIRDSRTGIKNNNELDSNMVALCAGQGM